MLFFKAPLDASASPKAAPSRSDDVLSGREAPPTVRLRRDRCGADGGHGAGDVQQTPAIDGVGAGCAQVGGGAEDQIDNLGAGQVWESLLQQRRRTRDMGSGHRCAGADDGVVDVVDGADRFAGGDDVEVGRRARLVGEAGNLVVGVDRTDRDAMTGRVGTGEPQRYQVGDGVLAVVAGGGHQDHVAGRSLAQGCGEVDWHHRFAAQRIVDDICAVGHSVGGCVGDVFGEKLARSRSSGGRDRIRPDRHDAGVISDAVRLNTVLAGADDRGDHGAVPVGIDKRLTLALRDDVGRSGSGWRPRTRRGSC